MEKTDALSNCEESEYDDELYDKHEGILGEYD